MTEFDVKTLRKIELKKELQQRGIVVNSHKKSELLRLLLDELKKEGMEPNSQTPKEKLKKKEFSAETGYNEKEETILQFVKKKSIFQKYDGRTITLQISVDEKHIIEEFKKKKVFIPISSIKDFHTTNTNTNTITMSLKNELIVYSTVHRSVFDCWVAALTHFVVEERGANIFNSVFKDIPKTFKAGVPQFFIIESHDFFHNKLRVGNDKWKVKLTSEFGEEIFGDVVDFEDGTYKIGFVVHTAGHYELSIELRNDTITEELTVFPDEIQYGNTMVDFPDNIKAGESFNISVVLRDKYKNHVQISPEDLKIHFVDSFDSIFFEQMIDHKNSYIVVLKRAKAYHVEIYFKNQQIFNHDFEVSPSTFSKFEVRNFPYETISLKENSFEIVLMDQYENLLTEEMHIPLVVSNEYSTVPHTTSYQDQIYQVKFTLNWQGKYIVKISINDGTTFTVTCLPNFNEDDRLKARQKLEMKIREEELERIELESRFAMKSELELKIEKKYPGWLSFKDLLNRLLYDLFPLTEFQKHVLNDSPSKDAMMKVYRKLLFEIHPDQLPNPTLYEKLEREVLFNKLQNSVEKYRKWN